MFNGLQEGIIVIDEKGKMNFINELANKVLTELSGLRNFFKNKTTDGQIAKKDQLDMKLFYVFENVQDEANSKKKKKKDENKASQSDPSKPGSSSVTGSLNEKTVFSLNEICELNVADLATKVFTFEKKLSQKDITKMKEEVKDIGAIIKNLPSMKGIDDEYIPKFKFFQIKKSKLKISGDENEKSMICFIDISQKILYDSSRAEGELLSLINSTISHEMRNPLNSIINQCKIIQAICQQFLMLIQSSLQDINPEVKNQL